MTIRKASAGSSAFISHQQRCGRAAVVGTSELGTACCTRHHGCSPVRRSLSSGIAVLHNSVILLIHYAVLYEEFGLRGMALPPRASTTSVDPNPLDHTIFSHTVMNGEKIPDINRRPVFTS